MWNSARPSFDTRSRGGSPCSSLHGRELPVERKPTVPAAGPTARRPEDSAISVEYPVTPSVAEPSVRTCIPGDVLLGTRPAYIHGHRRCRIGVSAVASPHFGECGGLRLTALLRFSGGHSGRCPAPTPGADTDAKDLRQHRPLAVAVATREFVDRIPRRLLCGILQPARLEAG